MKKLKYLTTGEIIWRGIKYPGFSAVYQKVSFDPNKWIEFWKRMIKEIKDSKLNYIEIERIRERFLHEGLMYGCTKQMIKKH